jgi:hypothetical protein
LGFYDAIDYYGKSAKGATPSKTLRIPDIKRFKYKYKSERSTKTPRYRFVKQQDFVSELDSNMDATEEPTEESHSPVSSNSSSCGNEESVLEVEPPTHSTPVSSSVDSNFDFGFDPERDANLVATNFLEQFSGDKVKS